MKEQLKKVLDSIKGFWDKQSKKKKIIFSSIGGGVLLIAIVITAFLNMRQAGYKVLYPGISANESAQVYATLQGMSASPQINSKGEVIVPKGKWDELVLELAGKGYPKTAPAYGVFLDNTGLTTTEFEKKQILLFQLQDRMQETLAQIEGIDSATVTIDLPQKSGYVWEESKSDSSAGVLVNMTRGYSLSPERVSAIKNLVAYSVPQMNADNVKVIDAATGVEMDSIPKDGSPGGYDFQRLDYERQVEKSIEDNVKRLLAPRYGADGVTAVAKVSLDYDKTVSESKEYVPSDNNEGVKNHQEERYTVDGNVPAGDIVGEENNTDVPDYTNLVDNTTGSGGLTNYEKITDHDVSYILTQIEKGQAVIREATVAVVVNESNFSTERRDMLIDLISKGVNISPNSISVTNLDFSDEPVNVPTIGDIIASNKLLIIIVVAGLALLIAIILIISSAFRKKTKAEEVAEQEDNLREIRDEIDSHKKMLKESAEAASVTKESAITNEIKTFSKQNPEITASLIRSMLKEDE